MLKMIKKFNNIKQKFAYIKKKYYLCIVKLRNIRNITKFSHKNMTYLLTF